MESSASQQLRDTTQLFLNVMKPLENLPELPMQKEQVFLNLSDSVVVALCWGLGCLCGVHWASHRHPAMPPSVPEAPASRPQVGLDDVSPLIAASRWGSLWGPTSPTMVTTLTRHRHLGQQSKHQHQYFEPLLPHVRSLLCVQE